MQEVFEELLQETRHLVSIGSNVHYYDNWATICSIGEWYKIHARVQHYNNTAWVITYAPIVACCPNFSAYVRHHQNQYSNE